MPRVRTEEESVMLHMVTGSILEAYSQDRGQRTEDRGQRTEDRGQRTEDTHMGSE